MGAGGRALCLQCLYYARDAIIMNREVANSPKPRAPCSTATLPDGASIHLFFMLSRAIWQLEAFFVHEVVKSSTLCDLAARRGSAEALSRRIEGGEAGAVGPPLFSSVRACRNGGAASRCGVRRRAAEQPLPCATMHNHGRRNGCCFALRCAITGGGTAAARLGSRRRSRAGGRGAAGSQGRALRGSS